MKVITLDSNKKIISVKNVGDAYVLGIGDLVSDLGEMGQIQQVDGSFITPMPPAPSLLDTQTSKIAQIQDLYNQALSVGFTSSATGEPIQFAYGISDQNKFLKLLVTITAGMVTYPVTVYAKNTTTYSLTQQQVMQLYKDVSTFEMGLEATLHTFINQVQACTTVDQVNAIVVSF